MKEKTIAAFIGSEGEVVAMTKKGCYHYNRELNEEQANKLLAKINEAQEINTEHWEVEWKYNGVDLGQGN